MSEISEVGAPATRYGRLPVALAKISAGALALAVLSMIYLHLVSIGRLDPLHTTVSDYVSVPSGGAFLALSTIAIALTTALLPARLAMVGKPVPPAAKISLVLGCVGLFASVVFPTNVLGTAADEATVLHRYAAALFFIAVPIAAVSLARASLPRPAATSADLASAAPARPAVTGRSAVVGPAMAAALARSAAARLDRWMWRFGLLSALVGIAFLISHIPLVFPGFPHADLIATVLPRGLVERLLLLIDIATIAVISHSARPVSAHTSADRLVRS